METILKEFESAFRRIAAAFAEEISAIRANRPSPALLENIRVDYEGQSLSLKQVGTLSVVPPREIDVTVWDKSFVAPTAKAIENAPMGLQPSVDGLTLRVQLPTLTDERRQELLKLVKSIAEKHRIRLRADRDDANKKIANAVAQKILNEDQKFKLKKQIQDFVDKTNKDIDVMLEKKIKEINE